MVPGDSLGDQRAIIMFPNKVTRDDQFIMFLNKAAFRMCCSHLQLFWGGKQERIRGVMVARFVDVFGVYVAWCCGQCFVFFGLRTGWILSSYLHPKIITSELFQINVGWFFSVPTPKLFDFHGIPFGKTSCVAQHRPRNLYSVTVQASGK